MGGGPYVLGQGAQRGQRGFPDERMHLSAEPQHTEADLGAAAQIAAYQGVLFQGGEQTVDDGPVDSELVGQLGDGQAVIGVGEQFEDAQSSVERLGGLRCHDALSSSG